MLCVKCSLALLDCASLHGSYGAGTSIHADRMDRLSCRMSVILRILELL